MTEHGDAPDMLDDVDLELLTDYLRGALSQERVAEVSHRLEHDEAFRNLAAPLIAAWSVAPRWKRRPMTRTELQQHWDDFTKRAGFVHQQGRIRRRRRFMKGTGIFLLVFSYMVWSDWSSTPVEVEPFDDVAAKAAPDRLMTFHDGTRVLLDPGARVTEEGQEMPRATAVARLEGTARFLVRQDLVKNPGYGRSFVVLTRAARVSTSEGDMVISARGDTTEVEMLRHFRADSKRGVMRMDRGVWVGPADSTMVELGTSSLRPGDRVRWIRGQHSEKLIKSWWQRP